MWLEDFGGSKLEKDAPWILVHAGAWAFYKAEI